VTKVIDLAERAYDGQWLPPGVTDMVYAYRAGDYCGYGWAVAWGNGLHVSDLSHCSCYGPFEDVAGDKNEWREVTPEDLRQLLDRRAKGYDPEASSVGQETEEVAYLLMRELEKVGVL
jgi:hypothetical protein